MLQPARLVKSRARRNPEPSPSLCKLPTKRTREAPRTFRHLSTRTHHGQPE